MGEVTNIMIVLTATTKDKTALTDIQKASAMAFGVSPNEHLVLEIPKDYPRHPSWWKIRALITHLPAHDHVLWMDSDAMFVRKDHWLWTYEQVASQTAPVALCRDYNGFNCGVMMWKRCPKAFEFLWDLYESYQIYQKDPWFEQAPFHKMAEAYQPHELPKRWNQYESELNSGSLILHLPAQTYEYRLKTMGLQLANLQKSL